MDATEWVIAQTAVSGLLDRLEVLFGHIRDSYTSRDKRMFLQWAAEYGRVWQQAQDDSTSLSKELIRLGAYSETGPYGRPLVDMLEEVIVRMKSHTAAVHAFMARVNSENPKFLIPGSFAAKESPTGCYIATAVYGSSEAPEVRALRGFRDAYLSTSHWGRACIKLYYMISPWLALRLSRPSRLNRVFKRALDVITYWIPGSEKGTGDRIA